MKYLIIILILTIISCAVEEKEKTITIEPQHGMELTDVVVEEPRIELIDIVVEEPEIELINIEVQEPQSELIDMVLKELGIKKEDCRIDLVVLKTYPNNPDETIIVIPEIAKRDKEDESYFEFNSHILIVDAYTGKIKHKYFESSETNNWTSDAVKLAEIKIDTAPYIIAENKRSFGVRVYFYNSSQPNPYSQETISLFIKDGGKLKQVLNNFQVGGYSGETDTNCYGEFTREEILLIITKEEHNGYFNILAKNRISHIKRDIDSDGECKEKIQIEIDKKILKFNNEEYE